MYNNEKVDFLTFIMSIRRFASNSLPGIKCSFGGVEFVSEGVVIYRSVYGLDSSALFSGFVGDESYVLEDMSSFHGGESDLPDNQQQEFINACYKDYLEGSRGYYELIESVIPRTNKVLMKALEKYGQYDLYANDDFWVYEVDYSDCDNAIPSQLGEESKPLSYLLNNLNKIYIKLYQGCYVEEAVDDLKSMKGIIISSRSFGSESIPCKVLELYKELLKY